MKQIKQLPTPRMQILWTHGKNDKELIATYELVLHEGDVCKGDIRANDKDDRPSCNPIKVRFGETKVTGGRGTPIMQDGTLDTPFRDGVHMLRDASALNLPMYVIYEDQIEQIPEAHKERVADFVRK